MEATTIAERYEVVRPLGRGSFGETLLARDLAQDQLVALKVLHPRLARDWKSFELFDREAAVLRGLRHHAIPAIYDAFHAAHEGSEAAFLVMEYVEGDSLAAIIAEQRALAPDDIVPLFLELLGVLDYLHSRVPPILHRDIKPANIILRQDGSAALVDFGSVRNVYRGADETGSTMVGTYGYMPYEQMMGQASAGSDLYALAATFLHLLTGRAPPEFMHESGRLQVPATLPCGEPLRSVLARMLSQAPAERFASARDARAALLSGAGTRSLALAAAPASGSLAVLGPVPRPQNRELEALLKSAAFGPGRILASKQKPGGRPGVVDVLLLALFSVLTAGVLPAVVWSTYRARKQRLRPFLTHGQHAQARVLDMSEDNIGFEIKLTRVRYEFEADGRVYRDSDQTLPVIAERWDRGSTIQVLYLPERDYDSVIISTA